MGGFAAYYCNQQIMNLIVTKYSLSSNNETIPLPPKDPCTSILKLISLAHQHNESSHSAEFNTLIGKITTSIKQDWITNKKALLIREYVEFEKLRKYLDHILVGKIEECDMRLAVVKSRKCWNYYTKLKGMFHKAMQETSARKQYLIGNISMECSDNIV
ncbi:uncharacterized protein Dere_GG26896 [Drosophila erecta]|uniref:Uncharacterized protein n=1 Tax=Drosophila erecta TaxID=7220 RepID=A0A0Q5TJB8_DROER|nr:uncharacterized protein Dere_GG26896 [Drosophila erecta]